MLDIAAKLKRYFALTQEETVLKKQKEPLSTDIKEFLRSTDGRSFATDELEASISDRGTVMDEAKVLSILKKLKRKDLIKKIEVPNMEVIEKLIYDQELDAALFADAVSPRQKDVLSVKKLKKKQDVEEE